MRSCSDQSSEFKRLQMSALVSSSGGVSGVGSNNSSSVNLVAMATKGVLECGEECAKVRY